MLIYMTYQRVRSDKLWGLIFVNTVSHVSRLCWVSPTAGPAWVIVIPYGAYYDSGSFLAAEAEA